LRLSQPAFRRCLIEANRGLEVGRHAQAFAVDLGEFELRLRIPGVSERRQNRNGIDIGFRLDPLHRRGNVVALRRSCADPD
jgi:hypothetical protein